MPANIREFHRTATVAQTLELLQRTETPTAALVTSPRVPDDPLARLEAVIDLRSLPLSAITVAGDTIHIGAMADLQAVAATASLAVAADGILAQAAKLAAHFGLRQFATVAGAIAGAYGDPSGPPEVLLALLVLDAHITLLGAEGVLTPLANHGPSQQAPLAEVVLPSVTGWHGALARVARTPLDQAIVAAVAAVSPVTARVAVAGASAVPFVIETSRRDGDTQAVEHLVGAVAARGAAHGDYRGSAAYRRAMAEVLTRRALTQALSTEASA